MIDETSLNAPGASAVESPPSVVDNEMPRSKRARFAAVPPVAGVAAPGRRAVEGGAGLSSSERSKRHAVCGASALVAACCDGARTGDGDGDSSVH